MEKITLAKALKKKNLLTNEINKICSRLYNSNSYIKENKANVDYNAKEQLELFLSKKDELVNLKSKINIANVTIQPLIYKLSELKDNINKIGSINTNSGIIVGGRYSEVEGKVEYEAIITKKDIDSMITKFEAEIESIQDRIDTYNHTTFIEI